jgi:hypothetical protein
MNIFNQAIKEAERAYKKRKNTVKPEFKRMYLTQDDVKAVERFVGEKLIVVNGRLCRRDKSLLNLSFKEDLNLVKLARS